MTFPYFHFFGRDFAIIHILWQNHYVEKLPLYISQISVLITTNDLGGQPAQQQPPQLQDPCRPHRRSLLRRLLRRHHHDLLRAQVGHQHQHLQPQTERREGCEFDSWIKQVLLISLQQFCYASIVSNIVFDMEWFCHKLIPSRCDPTMRQFGHGMLFSWINPANE